MVKWGSFTGNFQKNRNLRTKIYCRFTAGNMNFVAHFFLDRDNESPHFAIGAATPDLLSIYNPELRIKQAQIPAIESMELDAAGMDLLAGIERHFEADRIFHSSPLFARETGEISRALSAQFADGEVPRKYFIAHVLLELVLDKVLIEQFPNLLDQYYRHFEAAAPFLGVQADTGQICRRPLPNYDHFLQKFLENRYLYQYSRWDHIAYVLGRILRRVTIEERAFIEDPRFLAVVMDLESDLRGNYQGFFDEIYAQQEG